MLLVALVMALLGRVMISTNSVITSGEVDELTNEAIMTATGVGQAMVDRIVIKGFDHNCFGGIDTSATAFSAILGRDGAGEVIGRDTTFNDIDDYKGFIDSSATPRLGKFYVTCDVHYVNETPPFDSTGIRTYMKRINVRVTNSYMVEAGNPQKLGSGLTLSRLVVYR